MDLYNRSSEAQVRGRSMDVGLRAHMLHVYNYMASALLLTGLIAYFAGTSEAFLGMVLREGADGSVGMSGLGWLITFAPLAMTMFIGVRSDKLNYNTLQLCFWGFATLMGLSFYSIFIVYTAESIARVFFITAGTFGLLSIYGYSTKKDLTSWGTFLQVGLIAMLLVSLVNMFLLKSSGLSLMMSYVGVLLALGLTAYDTQKVKEMHYQYGGEGELAKKASLLGALSLYFSFIYLFVHLLRILGERR